MKPQQTIAHCEYCDSIIILDSPPSKKRYEKAEILISAGSILLSEAMAKALARDSEHPTYSRDISGYYCKATCLINRIREFITLT